MTAKPKPPLIIPPGASSMSLRELAAELLGDRLTLEQAHAVLGGRPCLYPDWRPGDAVPGATASAQDGSAPNACAVCGSILRAPVASCEVQP